jgi:hypothetical protein
MCKGQGTYFVDMRGRFSPYNDGLCDMEPCEECGGSGIVWECASCAFQRECDEDQP